MSEITVETTKQINQAQLRDEIAAALRISAPYVDRLATRLKVLGMVSEDQRATIEQAVADHVPDPDYGRTEEERNFTAIREKAKAVFAGTDTFTAAQVQKLLAALVLRETR